MLEFDDIRHILLTHGKLVAICPGIELLSLLDVAVPPFNHAHDNFGYRDRLSQPNNEGSGDDPTPGSGAPLKAGEFILGYPDSLPTKTTRSSPRTCRQATSEAANASVG